MLLTNIYVFNYSREAVAGPAILMVIQPGGRLNKKDSLTRYGDSHVKDKTS